jgi:hypothetical protein
MRGRGRGRRFNSARNPAQLRCACWLRRRSHLYQARSNELQPFTDMVSQLMAADTARAQAEAAARAQTTAPPPPPPVERVQPRPRPPLQYVPGVGMVEVVAPEPARPPFSELSVEERAKAVLRDPELVCRLGLVPGAPPEATTAASGASAPPGTGVASATLPVAVVAAPPIPVVPDLEPPRPPLRESRRCRRSWPPSRRILRR